MIADDPLFDQLATAGDLWKTIHVRFLANSKILKNSRRIFLGLAIFTVVFGLVASLPGSIEGLYHPTGFTGEMGCSEPQYLELSGGQMNFHVLCDCGQPSMHAGTYAPSKDGNAVDLRLSPRTKDEEGVLVVRAYPHLLYTHWVSAETGENFWNWKVPVTSPMRAWLAKTRMIDFVQEPGGAREILYDHDGDVIEDTFHPRKPKTPEANADDGLKAVRLKAPQG